MTPLFHLENIVRTYPDPASRDPHAVRTVLNLSELDIRAGKILGIRGHNGSGKSTLLRIIALLEPPDSGTVLFEGRPAGTDDLHLRRQVTLLLQTPYLLSRSVASNVAYGLRVRGIRNASELQNRIAASLLAVGLDPAVFLHRRRHELSGGECQRVALAARLALRPRVLLMDEPTASLDYGNQFRLLRQVRQLADSGYTVLLSTHNPEHAFRFATDVLVLREGGVRAFGPAAETLTEELLRETRGELCELSLAIAEKVIHVSLNSSSEVVARMIQVATEKLKRREWVHIYVGGCAAKEVSAITPELMTALAGLSDHIKIIPLSDDEAGTCIIEMPDEIIDASASTQLKNIRDLIHEI